MFLRERILTWLLKNHTPIYIRLKKIGRLNVGNDQAFLKLHASLVEEGRTVQSLVEQYNLWSLVRATNHLPGALAEVGVYRGGSAKIICEAKGESRLYLFDTFEGMPEVNEATDGFFEQGDFFDTSRDDVAGYLGAYPNVELCCGIFPQSVSGKPPEEQLFRFVHLDADIYKSTHNALAFFYPRMIRGGLILSHDYQSLDAPGVKQAFDDFFAEKPETVVPIWDSNCVVTKI